MKQRKRSRILTALAALSVTTLITLTIILIVSERYEHPDYTAQINAIAEERLDGRDNAWPELAALILSLYEEGHPAWLTWDQRKAMKNLLRGSWDDPALDEAKALLDRVRPTLAEFRAVAARDAAVRHYGLAEWDVHEPGSTPPPATLTDVFMPSLGELKEYAEYNTMLLREAAHNGDWDEAEACVRTNLALAEFAGPGVLILDAMVALSIQNLTLTELTLTLAEHDVPPAACARIADTIRAHARGSELIYGTLPGERAYMGDGIRHVIDGIMQSDEILSPRWFPPLVHARERRQMQAINFGLDLLEVRWLAPYDARAPHDFEGVEEALPIFGPLVYANNESMNHALRSESFTAATLLMLRLGIFHAQHNRWPDTLAEAVGEPGALDPVSGLPFEYEVLTDDPDGRPYELRAPADAWHFGPEMRVLNPARSPIPDRDEYGDPDFGD